MKKVICLIVIGEKYERIYNKNKSTFLHYSKKTGADLKIINTPPDPTGKRPLLSQKMLIPSLVKEYEIALYLDLDILINKNAPNIFDELNTDSGFAAVVDPRGTEEFVETWTIKNETIRSYFESRNFEFKDSIIGSINGGIFLFRPNMVSALFEKYYFSDHNTGDLHPVNEEAPIAYITQTQHLFQELDIKYNTQIIFKLKGTAEGKKIVKTKSIIPKFITRRYVRKNKIEIYPTCAYRKFYRKILNQVWILHFAGGYPI